MGVFDNDKSHLVKVAGDRTGQSTARGAEPCCFAGIEAHLSHRPLASQPPAVGLSALSARARALAPVSLRLRRDHIHLAASAACAAGIDAERLTALAELVEPETFRAVLRHLWQKRGGKLSSYTRDVASTLITIASEWVRVPADQLSNLKKLRGKLGSLRSGLTEKNKALLRKFEDPRLLASLLGLPDRLWRTARRNIVVSKRSFVDLQTALAIDILLHAVLWV